MITFTIENDTNNITAHATVQEAEAAPNAERFRHEAGLAKLAAEWPTARLVEIYNSLSGVSPVKKFTDRRTAVGRIWKALQSLRQSLPVESEVPAEAPVEAQTDVTATPVAPQTADVAAAEAPAPSKTTRPEKAPKPATQPKGAREGSKTAVILDLLKREGGVTSKELMTATGWQTHSVRGFLSGTVGKKMGLKVVSAKGESGERNYSITA